MPDLITLAARYRGDASSTGLDAALDAWSDLNANVQFSTLEAAADRALGRTSPPSRALVHEAPTLEVGELTAHLAGDSELIDADMSRLIDEQMNTVMEQDASTPGTEHSGLSDSALAQEIEWRDIDDLLISPRAPLHEPPVPAPARHFPDSRQEAEDSTRQECDALPASSDRTAPRRHTDHVPAATKTSPSGELPTTELVARSRSTGSSINDRQTMKTSPSKTLLTKHRLGAVKVTNAFDYEMLRGAVRRSVDASIDDSEADARAKRLQAALEMTQTIEHILTRRLRAFCRDNPHQANDLACRAGSKQGPAWLSRVVSTRSTKKRAFGTRKLQSALREQTYPSLAIMAGWLRHKWRIEPGDVADKLQEILGVPDTLEEYLFVAGETRNVIAHKHEYEGDSRLRLGPAKLLLHRDDFDGFPRIWIPDSSLELLQSIAMSIAEREVHETLLTTSD